MSCPARRPVAFGHAPKFLGMLSNVVGGPIARQSVQPSARRTTTQSALLSGGGHGRPSGMSLVTLCEILIIARFPSPAARRHRAAQPFASLASEFGSVAWGGRTAPLFQSKICG